jgi:hypothetical protein
MIKPPEYENNTGYPSVTDIISPYIDKAWFTEESRQRGSAVHHALALHLMGKWSPPVRNEWRGYVDSGRRWIDANVRAVILVETRLIDDEWKYCGQMDLIVHTKEGRRFLVDWKTGIASEPWWRLQAAAYRRLAEKNGHNIDAAFSLRLKADGSGWIGPKDLYKYSDGMMPVFAGMLNAYRFFN